MFICKTCLEENYTNFAMARSYGNCELCGQRKECFDIPTKNLNPKVKEPQMEMDFVHTKENNLESQTHLYRNQKRFNKNCQTVLNWLLEGKELKVLECANEGISSLPRRIKDLKEKEVQISDKWDGEVKVYYMTPEQIKKYHTPYYSCPERAHGDKCTYPKCSCEWIL